MTSKNKPTPVILRQYKNGALIALFPDQLADLHGNISSYQHVGQHGAASYSRVISDTVPIVASVARKLPDAVALLAELKTIGYEVKLCQRQTVVHSLSLHNQRAAWEQEIAAERANTLS